MCKPLLKYRLKFYACSYEELPHLMIPIKQNLKRTVSNIQCVLRLTLYKPSLNISCYFYKTIYPLHHTSLQASSTSSQHASRSERRHYLVKVNLVLKARSWPWWRAKRKENTKWDNRSCRKSTVASPELLYLEFAFTEQPLPKFHLLLLLTRDSKCNPSGPCRAATAGTSYISAEEHVARQRPSTLPDLTGL